MYLIRIFSDDIGRFSGFYFAACRQVGDLRTVQMLSVCEREMWLYCICVRSGSD